MDKFKMQTTHKTVPSTLQICTAPPSLNTPHELTETHLTLTSPVRIKFVGGQTQNKTPLFRSVKPSLSVDKLRGFPSKIHVLPWTFTYLTLQTWSASTKPYAVIYHTTTTSFRTLSTVRHAAELPKLHHMALRDLTMSDWLGTFQLTWSSGCTRKLREEGNGPDLSFPKTGRGHCYHS